MTTFDAPLILVAAPTRCGTTMITWLLHLHGAWIGEAKITKAPETNPPVGTENVYLKQYLKTCAPMPHDFKERLNDIYQGDGEPWVMKTALLLEKQEAFKHNYPDARWLLPKRPLEDIVASKMRHPGMKSRGEQVNKLRTMRHIDLQDRVKRWANNFLEVACDELATGNEHVAKELVEFAGLEFRPAIYREWIQPERWNNGR
jgi:hypothetical protein